MVLIIAELLGEYTDRSPGSRTLNSRIPHGWSATSETSRPAACHVACRASNVAGVQVGLAAVTAIGGWGGEVQFDAIDDTRPRTFVIGLDVEAGPGPEPS